MLKCKVKCTYHTSIDQVTIFVLKSFSDSHVLKLFGNLFHKLPAWYANELRPIIVVWHFGRRLLLSERRLWLVNIHCMYMGARPFKAFYTSITALCCHGVDTEGMCAFIRRSTYGVVLYCYCKQISDPSLAVFLRNSSPLYFDLPILMASTEDGIWWNYGGLPFSRWC